MNKFLSKDYKFLNLDDQSCEITLVEYYQKLKVNIFFLKKIELNLTQNIFEKSNNMTKKLEKLAENKAQIEEFTSLFSIIEKENLIVDKLEFYKQNLKDFLSWDQEVSKCLSSKQTMEV